MTEMGGHLYVRSTRGELPTTRRVDAVAEIRSSRTPACKGVPVCIEKEEAS